MDKEEFTKNFQSSLEKLIDFTQEMVINTLPKNLRFIILTNCFYDGNELELDEEVYPEDKTNRNSSINPTDERQVVEYLWRDGKIPEWINVQVDSCDENYTYISLECCGRYTSKKELMYHIERFPPFNPLSPAIPYSLFNHETDELIEKIDINKLEKKKLHHNNGNRSTSPSKQKNR